MSQAPGRSGTTRRAAGRPDHARGELRHPQRHGHRPLRAGEPRARPPHRAGAEPELVGHAGAQPRRASSSTSSPTTRRASRRCSRARWTWSTPCRRRTSTASAARRACASSRGRSCAPSISAWTRSRPELLKSDVRGRNPFQDVRVRRAFYLAIDVEAIARTVMRGQSRADRPDVGPGVNGFVERRRPPPAGRTRRGASRLLAEAGYPNGFGVEHGLPERPLRERRGDLHRRRRHAGAHRHPGAR